MRAKLSDTKGAVSRREVLLTVLIAAMAVFFGVEFMRYLKGQQNKGDDALRANTAESVALINSNNGMGCPVNGCGNTTGTCAHYAGGKYSGFFDDVSNSVIAKRPAGYNEYGTMEIGGEVWHGAPGTMVIHVTTGGSEVKLNWETGRT